MQTNLHPAATEERRKAAPMLRELDKTFRAAAKIGDTANMLAALRGVRQLRRGASVGRIQFWMHWNAGAVSQARWLTEKGA